MRDFGATKSLFQEGTQIFMLQLESKRTLLRRLKLSDFENMRKLESDLEIMKFTRPRLAQTPQQTQIRLEKLIAKELEYGDFGVWVAETKQGSEFVGWFMLLPTKDEYPELGFMIVKKYWGQGFAPEVCEALIHYGFETLEVPGVAAMTNIDNFRSIRVLEKVGFKFIKIDNVPDEVLGGTVDLKVFHLTKFQNKTSGK